MTNPGRAMPPGDDWIVRKLKSLQDQINANASARSLAASSIGSGGLTVKDGGSITIEPGGNITLADGDFNAENITASATMSAATVDATTVNATGNVNATNVTGTNNVTGLNVFAQSLATNITAGRVTLWGRTSDGYIATASSSERFKDNITPVDDGAIADAMLQIVVSYFQYKDEIRMRDDPTFENYVGPDYHVGTNIGAIAERLHELGLWQFVVYEHDSDDNLSLDADGQPIPYAIHDSLIGWGVLILAQKQQATITAQASRIDAFAARLAALDGKSE